MYRLRILPDTLDQLSDSLNLLEHLQSDIPNIEAQFEPLHDQFNILRKYEVQIPEEVEHQLDGLQGIYMAFQQCLIDSDSMLKKHKVVIYLCIIMYGLFLYAYYCKLNIIHIHICRKSSRPTSCILLRSLRRLFPH